MKWPVRDSFFGRAILISLAITLLFVGFGFWLTQELGRYERERMSHMPMMDHRSVINEMITEHKLSGGEALSLITRTMPPHMRHEFRIVEIPGQLGPDQYRLADGSVLETRMGSPGHRPPFPRLFGLGLVIAVVTLILGLMVSYLIVLWMLKRKARDAATTLAKIEKGDLEARIPVGSSDEFTGLAAQFNQMADAIQKLVQNLRDTEEARRSMLAELAHDLRTPVASLKTTTEILESHWQSLNDAKRTELTHMIVSETEYFQKLVDDLLFLSGVEDPRYRPAFKTIDLNALVEEIAISLGDKRIELVIEQKVLVNGDEILLRRMINNALTNAQRFAREKITLELNLVEGKRILKVVDDGKGLSSEALSNYGKRKFTRHWQKEEGGHLSIGLGSTIIAKIAQLHNFDLQVSTSKNGGAQILFEL